MLYAFAFVVLIGTLLYKFCTDDDDDDDVDDNYVLQDFLGQLGTLVC